jgi:hypothetical protein
MLMWLICDAWSVCVCVFEITTIPYSWQVLVVIDAKPKDLGLPTEAYFAVEEVHDVSKVLLDCR